MSKEIYIGCVFVSLIALLYIIGYIIRLRARKQLHKIFLMHVISLLVCNIGYMLLVASDLFFDYKNIIFEYVLFLGATFGTVFFLFAALIYKNGKLKYNNKYILIVAPQVLTNIILWTNSWHHLFYRSYGVTENYDFGPYFYVAMMFTWLNLISATAILVYASIKNSKNFTKQAGLMVWGTLIPVFFNFLWILGSATNIDFLKFYSYYDVSPITLTITAICFSLAIFKYDFLEVAPIALQKVVDCMADGYIVINPMMELVDYNRAFLQIVSSEKELNIKDDVLNFLKKDHIIDDEMSSTLKRNIETIKSSLDTIVIEKNIEVKNRIYSIELTPIRTGDDFVGVIIAFKDITELKRSQNALIEQERLASLGQLAGGMAHDINTPIATIRMGIDFLKGKHEYTEQEEKMLLAMKVSADKITDIVESVRNQIRNTGESQKTEFLLNKVIDNIRILVNNELEKHKCKLFVDVKEDITLFGDFGKLSQVIMNIVMNAIQAYNGDHGEIHIGAYSEDDIAVISIEDNAGGIPEKIAKGLFKEILTTKGTKGTGFGLYFAKSMMKAEFNGDITFETEEGKGTTFYVKIPTKREEE